MEKDIKKAYLCFNAFTLCRGITNAAERGACIAIK